MTDGPQITEGDLNECDREPIHLLGRVQGFGCLMATNARWDVTHISSNSFDILGFEVDATLGEKFTDVFPESAVHDIRTQLQFLPDGKGSVRLFGYDLFKDGRFFDITAHRSDAYFVMEFEPKPLEPGRQEIDSVLRMAAGLKTCGTTQELLDKAVKAMAALSGFDRIMIYKFNEDDTGTVLAEHRARDIETYLGLRFPATDIPKQARALYVRNLIRLIEDTGATGFEIIPNADEGEGDLDLSLSTLRSVSPIHLEYLGNMGVGASMSVSIVREGKLWGLVACHHAEPKLLDNERRTAIELFIQLFSYELFLSEEIKLSQELEIARDTHNKLLKKFTEGGDLASVFEVLSSELKGIVDYDGIAMHSEGQILEANTNLRISEIWELKNFLETQPHDIVFVTDKLSDIYPPAAAYADRAAGIISLSLSSDFNDQLIMFRKEVAQTVVWAGDPEKVVEQNDDGQRLMPRKSFSAWKEIVSGRCKPWKDTEIRASEVLRMSLIEIVVKLSEEAKLERLRAGEKQEVLIAELNHRVCNILHLIQGLISRSKDGVSSVESYTEVLDGRVHALARAHDQLTAKEWGELPFRNLIAVELRAYASDRSSQVMIAGDQVTLTHEAFSSMALVIHELVTNAVKYGSLKTNRGKVIIDTRLSEDGNLCVNWRELDGPLVEKPLRRGFGSTVIERTIPFELGGAASMSFDPSGLVAELVVPSRYIGEAAVEIESPQNERAVPDASRPEIVGNVLVLEDNMIIALDLADTMKTYTTGEVFVASNVADAMIMIDKIEFGVAILDINLGSQTSLQVAETLFEKNVPFMLATGFGETGTIVASYPKGPIIKKPYVIETLEQALLELIT